MINRFRRGFYFEKYNRSKTEKILLELHPIGSNINDLVGTLEKAGMIFSGINPQQNLVEIAELKDHPFMVGSQFHPEFKSRPNKPHPLFKGLVEESIKYSITHL